MLNIPEKEEAPEPTRLALETVLYTAGASAVGMFVRWMQKMLAFDDNDLPNPGFWHYAYVAIIIIAAIVFIRRTDRLKNRRMFIPSKFGPAYRAEGKIYVILELLSSLIIIVGAALVLANCEAERNASLLRITSILGIISAIILPLLMRTAVTGLLPARVRPLLSSIPILWVTVWLISTYVGNSINSVVLDYGLEIITVCVLMISFYRFAGAFFASFVPNRVLFFSMFSCFMCVMCLADDRLVGLQIMLFGIAVFFGTLTWILVRNAVPAEDPDRIAIDTGFERLH